MKNPALVTIFAIVASVLIVAYLLAFPDMDDVKLNTKCFLSHIEQQFRPRQSGMWRRCACSMPATTPGTAIDPGP